MSCETMLTSRLDSRAPGRRGTPITVEQGIKGPTYTGFETVLMEPRQVKAALKAMPIETVPTVPPMGYPANCEFLAEAWLSLKSSVERIKLKRSLPLCT